MRGSRDLLWKFWDPVHISVGVSSFLTARQHILGYSVPSIHSELFTVW